MSTLLKGGRMATYDQSSLLCFINQPPPAGLLSARAKTRSATVTPREKVNDDPNTQTCSRCLVLLQLVSISQGISKTVYLCFWPSVSILAQKPCSLYARHLFGIIRDLPNVLIFIFSRARLRESGLRDYFGDGS